MTDYTFYVAVVAHEKRRKMAEELSQLVDADKVFYDDGFLGEWRNHYKALRAGERSGATHVVVLQDDALPVEGFSLALESMVEEMPNELISLYVGTHKPRAQQVEIAVKKADQKNAAWLTADTLMWGVGIVVPALLISEMLDHVSGSKLPYDQRLGLWAEDTGRDVYYTWPSLVDHADEPTVIAGRSKKQGRRVAHRVGIPSWNDETVRIERPDDFMIRSKRDQ
jgi:hypothetical protein